MLENVANCQNFMDGHRKRDNLFRHCVRTIGLTKVWNLILLVRPVIGLTAQTYEPDRLFD